MTPPLVCGDSCVLFVCTLSMTGKSTLYKRRGHFILSIIFLLFLVFDKNLEKALFNTSPLLHALFSGKLRGEVFDSNHGFSAGNDMRITVISEGADNNNDHLPWVLSLYL